MSNLVGKPEDRFSCDGSYDQYDIPEKLVALIGLKFN